MPAATTSGWLDEKVADAALTTKRLVHITLGDVTLKLTLTSKFLGRPFLDAVVKPFLGARPRCLAAQRLGIPTVPPRTPVASNNPTIFRAGAYNKKSGEAVKLEDVLSAIIDGVPCHELSTSAAALLPLADWTRVELQLSGSGPATTPTLARVPVPDSSRDWREAARPRAHGAAPLAEELRMVWAGPRVAKGGRAKPRKPRRALRRAA